MPGQLCEHGNHAHTCQRCIDAYPFTFPDIPRRDADDTPALANLHERVEALGRQVAAMKPQPAAPDAAALRAVVDFLDYVEKSHTVRRATFDHFLRLADGWYAARAAAAERD